MGTVARAEPTSVVTSFTDGNTTKMCADTKHNKPLRSLCPLFIGLGITQSLDVNIVGLINLIRSSVSDEHWLSSPLDDKVLSLGNGTHLNLNLRQRQNIRRSGHVTQHIDRCALHTRGTKSTEGTDHKVGDVSGGVGVLGTVGAEIGDISGGGRGGSGDISGSGEESLLEARWCGEGIGPTDVAPGTSLKRPSSGDVGPRTRLAVVAVAVGVTGSGDGEGDAASEGSAGGESAGTGKEVDSADVGGHFCGLGDVAREME